ncbi:MAG: 3-dehydroquinate synthase [Xanthomonadales bacterium]|jgi:3-dehydroquinate synthase|nr:3-dehydroquinate synthase [Xanthomonadales bacterium]
MKTINIELPANSYPVYLGRGLLLESGLWDQHLGNGKILVVSNETVAPLYLETLLSTIGSRGCEVHVIPDGEQFKTVETWQGILDRLVEMQARRDASIVALGGGVVGDISGFAAASYMRGIRFLQVPTTLLAQVDASVGGKTGVNHVRGKNLVGAFHQPATVLIDSATLDTLQAREFNAGLAEVVKYGAICDKPFFEWLENNAPAISARENWAVDYLIERSVLNKADIVRQDEKEAGVRALLNFGHSFGHALESETAYSKFLHGEAVSIGMVTAARLSESRGLCASGTAKRLAALLESFGLPVSIPGNMSAEGLGEALALDKKAIASGLRLVLLHSIGKAVVDNGSSHREISAAIQNSMG